MKFKEFSCEKCVAWGETTLYRDSIKRQCFLNPPPFFRLDGKTVDVPVTHPDFKCWQGFVETRAERDLQLWEENQND